MGEIDQILSPDVLEDVSKDLHAILDLIFFQLKRHLRFTSSAVFVYVNEEFNLLDYGKGNSLAVQQVHMALLQVEASEILLNQQSPTRISDTLSYAPLKEILEEWPDQEFRVGMQQVRSWLALPLIQHGALIGALTLGHPAPDQFEDYQIAIAASLIRQVLAARSKLYARVENRAIQEERLRLARDLHDSVTQVFYGIQLEATSALNRLNSNDSRAAQERLTEIIKLAEGGLAELRTLILQLHPESLQSEGLRISLLKLLTAVEKRHSLKIESKLSPEPLIPLQAKEGLYRISQEILQNVVKHSRATQINFSLVDSGSNISLEIADNGRGFDSTASFPGHFGLVNIKERASLLHAHLKIDSHPGHGTCIRLDFPLYN